MAIVETMVMGTVEYEDKDIIHFRNGIPGFEEVHQYLLLMPDPKLPFSFLQALEPAELHFLLADPFHFFPEYTVDISDQVQKELGLETEADVALYCVVTASGEIEKATANLLAPIVMNRRTLDGKQLVLQNTGYTTRHSLFPTDPSVQSVAEEG